MKKLITVLMAAALITAFSVPVFAGTTGTQAANVANVTKAANVTKVAQAAKVTKVTMKARVKGSNVKIKYPKISGLSDKKAQAKINATLKKYAKNALKRGKKNVVAMKKAKITDVKASTYFNYSVTYNKDGLFSALLTENQYAGGAHGYTVLYGKTFNLQNGAVVKLKALFNNKAGAYKVINDKIKAKIAADKLQELVKFKSIKDSETYCLTDKGIRVYFQQYEYFCYAVGIQTYDISYSELQPYMAGKYSLLNPELTELSSTAARTLKTGQYGYIKLDGNETTGYQWTAASDNTKVATVSSYYVPDPAPAGIDGAGGTEIVIVKGVSAGTARITCTYARSWETSGATSKEFDITVE